MGKLHTSEWSVEIVPAPLSKWWFLLVATLAIVGIFAAADRSRRISALEQDVKVLMEAADD